MGDDDADDMYCIEWRCVCITHDYLSIKWVKWSGRNWECTDYKTVLRIWKDDDNDWLINP